MTPSFWQGTALAERSEAEFMPGLVVEREPGEGLLANTSVMGQSILQEGL
jgi:hypothetical protein